MRSKVNATASAVNGEPSWNLTPDLRWKTYSLPSAETSHFSASSGSTSVLPDLYFTRPSYMAVVAMKPSWASIAGGSRRLVSLPHRNVSVLAAVAPGLDAGAVVGAAAGGGAGVGLPAGAVVAALAGAVGAAAAGP